MATTVVIFFMTLSAADSVGFVPYYVDGTSPSHADGSLELSELPTLGTDTNGAAGAATVASAPASAPNRIRIAAIDLDLPVQNPTTRDINSLDVLLQNGPARYVDSAQLGESGNVLIFAHSSHLPVVRNQMFRAFNRIPELTSGEMIVLTGKDGRDYLYRVDSVRSADANEATIDLSAAAGTKLTLVTCDTLTSKSARFVLEATFVGVTENQ